MKWGKVKLEDIVKLTKGKKHSEVADTNAYRYLQIEDLHGSGTEKYTNEDGVLCESSDLLIAWDGANAGKVGTGLHGMAGSTLARISVTADNVSSKYLYWYLSSNFEVIKSKRTGATIPHVNGSELRSMMVPLPPFHIQEQIADTLDKADALRRKDQELLQKYDELAQAIFYDMFGDPVRNEKGWEEKPLDYFISKLTAGVSVNSTDEISDCKKPAVLKTSCVYTGKFRSAERKVIKADDLHRAKVNPSKDTIIISRMNTAELVGKSAYVDKDYDDIFLPDRLWMTEKTNSEHSVLWLSYVLSSKKFMEKVSSISSGTSGSMKNISKSEFLKLRVIAPPSFLQKRFEQLVNKVDQILKQQSVVTINSQKIFDAYISQVFS